MDIQTAIAAARFGYGLPVTAASAEGMLREIASFKPAELENNQQLSQQRLQQMTELRRAAIASTDVQGKAQYRNVIRTWLLHDRHDHVIRSVWHWPPLFSRLVEFWTNHFTISARKAGVQGLAGPFVLEAIAPNVMGRFADLLIAAELHPAMAAYLDLTSSIGPRSRVGRRTGKGLNENLAREILELHTLGVQGGYKQQDVTEFAKIMTGWMLDIRNGSLQFLPRRAEPGIKTFLGRRFGAARANQEEFTLALEFIARQPPTARFISSKLARHFLADEPPPEAVDRLSSTFLASDGNLFEVYRTLCELPQAKAPLGAKARNGFEFLVAALRTSSLREEQVKPRWKDGRWRPNGLGAGALDYFQQPLWEAPSPAGWPETLNAWLSPVALVKRLNWIPRLVRHVEDQTAANFLDRVLGPLASKQTRSVIMAASTKQEGLSLVLASPEFNRR